MGNHESASSLCVDIDVSKAILDIAASSAIEQFRRYDSDGWTPSLLS